MQEKVRKTAIDIIGDVPWGTHFCQFYQTKEDLVDILVPYFKAGLENNEFCMWITSEPLHVEDAKRALKKKVKNLDDYIKKGQIEILDYTQWYTKAGRFDANEVLDGWIEKEKQALERGFEGLRLSGNTFWLEKRDWKDFTDYEAAVNSVIGQHHMLAICTYCLDKCTASEIMDVVSNHQFALVKRQDKWEIIESAEHRKTVEALRQSEVRYRAVVEDQTELIVRWQPGGVINFVNDAYCSYFGKSRKELIGHSFMPLIPYEDREKVKRDFDSLDRENPVATHEHRVIASNGDIRWQQWTNRVIFDERGNLVEYQSVGRDITNHKLAEETLQEREDKYRAIFEQAADSVVLIDTENGDLVEFNDRTHENLGYTREEFRKLKIPDFEVIESAEQVEEHIENIIRQGGDTFETKHRTKGGEIRDVLASSRVISIGGRDFIQSIWRDITERKRAEEALRIHDLRLQALLDLNKMTTASQQQILDFVREEVIKITESRFAFIGFISHDESMMTINNWSKGTMPKCAVTDKPMHFPIAKAGLWGEAVRQRKPVVINDYTAPDPRKKGFPKGHVPIKRFLGIPVFEGERIVAVAAVANKEEDYDDSDVHAVTSMMNDMWRLIQRKRAQEQVRNLAKFPSEDPNPVLRIAKNGVVLYANDASRSLLAEWGCRVGQTAPENWCRTVSDVFASGSARRIEIVHADSVFAFMVVPVVEADYVNLYGRDITERKRATEQIENLAKFPSENPFPVLRITKDGTVLYSNDAGSALLSKWERQVGESAPQDWCQLIGDVLDSNRNKIIEVKYGKHIISFVLTPVAKAGYVNIYGRDVTKQKIAEQALQKARDDLEEKVRQRTAELSDVVSALREEARERSLAQQELQQSEARLQDAQRIAHIGNWDWDIVDNQLWWSDEVYRIFGLRPQEFGATYEAFLSHVHPDDREFVKQSVNEALYEYKPYSIDHRVVWPDSTERIVHEQAEIIHNADNSPIRMRGTVQDVTAQKQTEEKILDNQKQLRSLTAELLLSEERERRKIATDLHDSVGQILAFSDRELGILQKSTPDKLKESVEEIRHHIKQAVKQTRTLTFDLSPPSLYDLGFEAAVEELIEQFSKERKIECSFESRDQHKPLADHVKILLYRSIRELLMNIAKHSTAKLVRIASSRVNNDILITVEDDGAGFDISRLESKEDNSGGFGLFSIRERLTHIGGKFDIQSGNGKGTRITLLVPLKIKN